MPYAPHLEDAALPQPATSSPRRGGSCAGGERLPDAVARRRHGGRHAGRVADQARRPGQTRRCRRCRRNPEGRDRGRDLRGRDRLRDRRAGRHQGSGRRRAGADRRRAPHRRARGPPLPRRCQSRAPLPAPAPPAPRAAVPVSPAAKVTPAARRRAAELGIDLRPCSPALASTARSRLADVETAAASRPASPAPANSRAARASISAEMRKAIAAAMARSKREIPHYYLSHTVDLGAALAWLEGFNAAQPVPQRLLPATLLLKASALALREVPQLNGIYADGALPPRRRRPYRLGDLAARRRAGRAGDPRRRLGARWPN